ncbi:MAG: heavy metal translocating P-type ATPase [Verrucomicrobiota bacterium]
MSGKSSITHHLSISGMTCQNCARHATEALQNVSGVQRVRLQLEPGAADVTWEAGIEAKPSELLDALDQVGFKGTLEEPDATSGMPSKSGGFWSGWGVNLAVGLPAFALMMVGDWVLDLGTHAAYRLFSLLLATAILLISGSRFFKGAWQQLKRGQSNMDTLVSLGASAAYVFSLWGWWTGQLAHLYFMETVGILTLISLGHWMEGRAGAKATSALQSLMQLAPQRARKRMGDGGMQEVDVASLRLGDLVEVRPGDQVPTDGVVIEGHSSVNESMLTGESMPVDKSKEDKIYAATLNGQGNMLVRVTGLGEETALARIIQVVERAQSSRANIQRLGDQVSSVFVPIVVLLAVVTLFGWLFWPGGMQTVADTFQPFLWTTHAFPTVLAAALIHSVAVLIVACPCAMGLATPAAIMAGTNAAAARGILIRDGVALEKSGTITALAFDKTGTLTEGEPGVAGFEKVSESISEEEFQSLSVSLAEKSTHPLSRAIARHWSTGASNKTFLFEKWTEKAGAGVEGAVFESDRGDLTSSYRLGSLKWLEQSGVVMNGDDTFHHNWMAKGATVVGVAKGKESLGFIALRDTLKQKAAAVVGRLLASGWQIHLITGDHHRTGQAIADELGLSPGCVHAEVKPEDKASIIRSLQQKGERVAYVGDGINDAPALEQADLGIAVSRASDIAREAADILLLKADIEAIPEALDMARATLRTIKQNLFWAFFYNAAAIPLAMFGFMNPLLCAAAMGFSDVLVIGNALRLRWRSK